MRANAANTICDHADYGSQADTTMEPWNVSVSKTNTQSILALIRKALFSIYFLFHSVKAFST
jgi:hypothetical protein